MLCIRGHVDIFFFFQKTLNIQDAPVMAMGAVPVGAALKVRLLKGSGYIW